MSSNLLHQAVQLAQAGQKAEARQLILQFLQTEPNNETAWLWLASVAADQIEYQRALNEVLRINPSNQRAQQLLTEFEQQHGGAARYAPPQQPVSPPPVSPYAPPQQQVSPPPVSPYAPPQQPVSPPPPTGVPYSPPTPVEVKVKTERRRGCLGCTLPGCGCLGCGQGCILAFLVLVILPAVVCGGLSLSPISLGPFDLPASFLPGEAGRKDVKFTTSTYDISLETPRSWYLVQTNDQMWTFWSNALESTVPFEASDKSWSDLETDTTYQAVIVEVNPVALSKGGDVIALTLDPSTVQDDFSCNAVRAKFAGATTDYQQVFDYSNGLCGYRANDEIIPASTTPVFKSIDPPGQERKITFYTPVSSSAALKWQISIPQVVYTWDQMDTKDDIQTLIGSVKAKVK